MIFSQVTSQLALVAVGLAWPAYSSYKAAALPATKAQTDWLIYWIVLAVFLAVQWLTDLTISWLPLYWDAKVVFVVMLWHPKVKGAVFLYAQYLEPLLKAHEGSIDRSLGEAQTRALDYLNSHVSRLKQYASSHTAHLLEHVKQFSEQGGGTPQQQQQGQQLPQSHAHKD